MDTKRGPLIGISSGRGGIPVTEGVLAAHYVGRGYVRAVHQAGGTPLVLPAVEGSETALADQYLDLVDGIVLAGGNDIDPRQYGQPDTHAVGIDPVRDTFELALLAGARARDIPVLGICRGMELINVAYGGTLKSGVHHPSAHDLHLPELGTGRVHQVDLEPDSRARALFDRARVEAVCVHHQAPDRIGQGLRVTGRAADGEVEILEDPDQWVLGVIWHPEQALDRDPQHLTVYQALVQEAAR